MWRRKEGLAAWLAGGRRPGSHQLWLGAWRRAAMVGTHAVCGEVPLTMGACVHIDDVVLAAGRIVDGLAAYSVQDKPSERAPLPHKKEGVMSLGLLGKARVGESMVALHKAPTRSLELVRTPRLKSPTAFPIENARVQHGGLPAVIARVCGGSDWFVKTVSVGNGVLTVSNLPHRRTSVDLGRLSPMEIEGFLLEAEAKKEMAPGCGKLLAVFPHVPVEMINSVRIVDSGRRLVYTVSKSPRQKRTRVHDLAAVLDTTTKTVHLIPHRTRYQTLTLM